MKFVIKPLFVLLLLISNLYAPAAAMPASPSVWTAKTPARVQELPRTSGKSLQDKAQMALIKQLGSNYSRIELKPLSKPKSSEYALDGFKASAAVSFPVARRVCVWLIHGKQRIPVWFRVRAYARVLIANRLINYNSQLPEKAFSWQERDIAGLNGQPARSIPKRAWTKSFIEEQGILLTRQLKQPPLIAQGQVVKVNFHNQHVRLVMDAVALADGYLSQMIRVKNPLTQKSFFVKVIGSQEAEVSA